MKVKIRSDSVEIEGYVNAVERNSKPLMSRIGQFIERVCKGTFAKALKRNDDVLLLLNHDPNRILARTKDKTLDLREDSIGLHARATITDQDVVEKAKNGDLVGWSFGFLDREVENGTEQGMPLRKLRDIDLQEVSILDRRKTPAYDGTFVAVRDDDNDVCFRSEAFIDDVIETEETKEETKEETREDPQQDNEPVEIDYSKYEAIIAEMKGETK